jgi:hypothetical protein
MRHTVGVAADGHRRGEACNMNIAIESRKRGLFRHAQAQHSRGRSQQCEYQKPRRGPKQSLGPAPFAVTG